LVDPFLVIFYRYTRILFRHFLFLFILLLYIYDVDAQNEIYQSNFQAQYFIGTSPVNKWFYTYISHVPENNFILFDHRIGNIKTVEFMKPEMKFPTSFLTVYFIEKCIRIFLIC